MSDTVGGDGSGATLTVALVLLEPPWPVQDRPYTTFETVPDVFVGVTTALPAVAPPVENPVPRQLALFVPYHASSLDCPLTMLAGDALRDTVGGGTPW